MYPTVPVTQFPAKIEPAVVATSFLHAECHEMSDGEVMNHHSSGTDVLSTSGYMYLLASVQPLYASVVVVVVVIVVVGVVTNFNLEAFP